MADGVPEAAAKYFAMARSAYENYQFGRRMYKRDVINPEKHGVLFVYLVLVLGLLLFLFLVMVWWCRKDGRPIL
jgi:hypothetical protein